MRDYSPYKCMVPVLKLWYWNRYCSHSLLFLSGHVLWQSWSQLHKQQGSAHTGQGWWSASTTTQPFLSPFKLLLPPLTDSKSAEMLHLMQIDDIWLKPITTTQIILGRTLKQRCVKRKRLQEKEKKIRKSYPWNEGTYLFNWWFSL